MNSYQILIGDCLELLRRMPDCSVDSVVTDPPYGLSFMGKKWDYDVPATEVWAECLRVLKPGGHLLAFAGTRTQHRMAVRIEDAGFEIRDMIAWVYGSGFPKSHNLDGEHAGWGTALKPALEPITVARKPFAGTVAANVQAHGTGALNIDGCRVRAIDAEALAKNWTRLTTVDMRGGNYVGGKSGKLAMTAEASDLGRWPANLIHDGSAEVIEAFPDAPGQLAAASTSDTQRAGQNCYGNMKRSRGAEASADSANSGVVGFQMKPGARRLDSGSAARFFYCAKTSRTDRHEGLLNPGPQFQQGTTLRKVQTTDTTGNNHPTVKPTDLMAYLLRLVTPAGGIALDPFMGSGSTGKAAMREGFQFIGCEIDEQYAAIARARIDHEVNRQQELQTESDQLDLFGTA
ncbi:site-specific DNA-methyltransferase [Pseudomonas sp. HMWF006]|uniref:DNA-methyltransferase n=1 Tax=Pseudomonas sp. HMWF006 TaxID=2056843 RepID=UPI000D4A2570|nr:site-specific DNA-methyltransferase [Pseudomonas sp. HMWF006]PTT02698.1 site-specific DNA-methyltransferase [Pseudomonas sp. HMWF006]PTT68623.1 site-specific DNA-methyltransferase [Pseudomonas sp. HMWF007]PTT93000.1 site-specific DNA-methyltransferase [Pseudomonas sp. HMWF005]